MAHLEEEDLNIQHPIMIHEINIIQVSVIGISFHKEKMIIKSNLYSILHFVYLFIHIVVPLGGGSDRSYSSRGGGRGDHSNNYKRARVSLFNNQNARIYAVDYEMIYFYLFIFIIFNHRIHIQVAMITGHQVNLIASVLGMILIRYVITRKKKKENISFLRKLLFRTG